mgnify:CR=1 FL=1
MKYDFTSIIDRHGMDSIAVDSWGEIPGMAPAQKIIIVLALIAFVVFMGYTILTSMGLR